MLFGRHVDAQRIEAAAEGIAAGVLAEHELVGIPAHILGTHDLVGFAMLEHAVLVDARFVGEGVGADDGLVRLDRIAGDLRHQFGGGDDLGRIDPALDREDVGAGAHCHHDLFERGVAGAFAQAVDGAFDLAGACHHRCQRVETARPRSLWQCTDQTTLSEPGTRSIRVRIVFAYCSGTL